MATKLTREQVIAKALRSAADHIENDRRPLGHLSSDGMFWGDNRILKSPLETVDTVVASEIANALAAAGLD